MNKSNFFWVGYYFGQNIVIHPETGLWYLSGFFDDQVVCQKYEDGACIDCMYYPISEVQFILKKINPFLFASMGKFHWWIKQKASEGYFMFPNEGFNQVIYQP